ncbi:pyridoxal phosphate-dependent aminotransferase [Mesorhizobium sp. WSM2239]|uniref:Pyridoxal phosphate-dependent aminotransferase n=2 Tax=unclassified Mesorhizobium TaxID=325217 RepID=A0AAU8D6L3_9HYPH
MPSRPPLTPVVDALPATVPFVGPEAQQRASGRPFRARIGANESSFGPSPSVMAAMRASAPDMWMYCDPDNHDLKVALAGHLGVQLKNVVVGQGIDGLLNIAVRMHVAPGDAVVTSLGAYPTFNFHVAASGGRLVTIPYENDRENLDGLLAAVRRENAHMVYLSNPDNPMGTWWEADEITRFVEALPETTMLILDEAYGETGPTSAMPPLDPAKPNVLRMRTFSKAYGLAGIRCGYAIGEAQAIADFEKIRDHYGVSRMAQIAGLAALADQAYLHEVVAKVAAGRDRIAEIARANGLSPIASATNFVTIDCGRDGAIALKVLQHLISRGVFIRKPMAPGLDRCIRISVGRDDELDIFAEELPGALEMVRG